MRILIKSQSFVKLLAIASLVLAIFMLTNISTISHGSFAYGQNINSNNNQIFYSSVSKSNDNSYSIQNEIIPAAESVYKSQTMIMPSSVGTL